MFSRVPVESTANLSPAFVAQISTGAPPLDPAGDFRSKDPLVVDPFSKFLATPLYTTHVESGLITLYKSAQSTRLQLQEMLEINYTLRKTESTGTRYRSGPAMSSIFVRMTMNMASTITS